MAAFSRHTVVLTWDPMGKNVLKSSPLKPVSQYSKHVIAMFALNWLTGFRREDF
jgi:hypothetical protein